MRDFADGRPPTPYAPWRERLNCARRMRIPMHAAKRPIKNRTRRSRWRTMHARPRKERGDSLFLPRRPLLSPYCVAERNVLLNVKVSFKTRSECKDRAPVVGRGLIARCVPLLDSRFDSGRSRLVLPPISPRFVIYREWSYVMSLSATTRPIGRTDILPRRRRVSKNRSDENNPW